MLPRRSLLPEAALRGALRCHAHGRRAWGTLRTAVVVVLCVLLLRCSRQEACSFVPPASSPLQEHQRSRVARSATSATAVQVEDEDEDEEEELVRPELPKTTEAMLDLASAAVMRAYMDGFTRQNIRLRIDGLMKKTTNSNLGPVILKNTLQMAEQLTKKFWYGSEMKDMKISSIDDGPDESSTLLYRESTNSRMDCAMLYMMSREVATTGKVFNWIQQMGDRLVVLANTETATAPWEADPNDQNSFQPTQRDLARQVQTMFAEKTFYFHKTNLFNWQTLTFRAYPFPWEIWIEDLDYNLVKLGETKTQPDAGYIVKLMEEYEAKNGISQVKKLSKSMKDIQDFRYDSD